MLQHALFTVPNYSEGYTTDDNARALMVGRCSRSWAIVRAKDLATRYLALCLLRFQSRDRTLSQLHGLPAQLAGGRVVPTTATAARCGRSAQCWGARTPRPFRAWRDGCSSRRCRPSSRPPVPRAVGVSRSSASTNIFGGLPATGWLTRSARNLAGRSARVVLRRIIRKSGTGTKIGSPTATRRSRMPCSCAANGCQTTRWPPPD